MVAKCLDCSKDAVFEGTDVKSREEISFCQEHLDEYIYHKASMESEDKQRDDWQ